VQANLARDPSVAKAFKSDDGSFDIVFNCAGMTTYGQGEPVYQEHIYDLGMKCAREAARTGVKRWIEVSTAQVYAADKVDVPAVLVATRTCSLLGTFVADCGDLPPPRASTQPLA